MRKIGPVILAAMFIVAVSTVFADAPKSKESRPQPRPDSDGWYSLFNGKNLRGWKTSEQNQETFKVVDGEIVVKGKVCHLFYVGKVNDAKFKNFEWKCEILTKPGSNSGMYFHTKYQKDGFPLTGLEAQIDNSHKDPRRTGSLYKVKDIMDDSPAKDDEWFTQTVIVKGNHITVKVNDKVVNEFDWPENFKREGIFKDNLLGSGTFALQGHDPKSEVHFRKIMVKPLPNK